MRRRLSIVLGSLVLLAAVAGGAYWFHQYRVASLARAALAEARVAHEAGRYAEASESYLRYLLRWPDDREVLAARADVSLRVRPLQQQNLRDAINCYRRLLLVLAREHVAVDDPAVSDIFGRLARLYEQTGNFTELAFIGRKRMSEAPDDLRGYQWFGKAMLVQHDLPKAREALEALVKRAESRPDAGDSFVQACDLLSAIAFMDRAPDAGAAALTWVNRGLERHPDSVDGLLQRASLRRELGRAAPPAQHDELLKDARADLERAESLQPRDLLVRLAIVEEWLNAGELQRAEALLAATVTGADEAGIAAAFIDPDDWTLSRFLPAARLALLSSAGECGAALADEALAALSKARQRVAMLPLATRLYVAANQAAKARACLDEYVQETRLAEAAPQRMAETALLQALVALAENKPFDAVRALEPFAARSDASPAIRRVLAEAYLKAGQSERALPLLRDYAAAQPADVSALTAQARSEIRRGAWSEAIAAAQAAAQARPDDPLPRLLRIEAMLGQARSNGKLDDATAESLRSELDALRTAHPKRGDVFLLIADFADLRGDSETAEHTLREAVEQCDDRLAATFRLAAWLARRSGLDEAVQLCAKAQAEFGQDPRAYLASYGLFENAGRSGDALAALDAGLARINDAAEQLGLRRQRALHLLAHEQRLEGIKELRALAGELPADLELRDTLLNLTEVSQDAALAQQLINELKLIEGEQGVHWRVQQARQWISGGQGKEKRREVEDALRFTIAAAPSWDDPVLLLGRYYESLGLANEAETTYRSGLAANPRSLPVADRLLNLLEMQGRAREALALTETLRKQTTSDSLSRRSIALSLAAGELGGAIQQLELRAGAEKPDVDELVLLARLIYLQDKNAELALRHLDQAEQLEPERVDVLAARVFVLRGEERLEEARNSLDAYVSRHDNVAAQLLRANFLRSTGQSDAADELLAGLTISAQDADGFALLGEYHAREGRLDQAIEIWRKGLERFGDDARLKRGLSKALILRKQADDLTEAGRLLDELQRALPDDADLDYTRAMLALQNGDRKAARQALGQALAHDPASVDAYAQLIPIVLGDDGAAAAQALVIRALSMRPNDDRLLAARAFVELALGNVGVATEAARQALKTNPDNAQALDALLESAFANADLARLQQLSELVQRGVERGRPSRRVLIAQALLRLSASDPPGPRLGPPEVLAGVASVLGRSREAGQRSAARSIYAQLVQSRPDDVDSQLALAVLTFDDGDVEQAVASYRAVLERQPDRVEALNNLAWTLAQIEPPDPARLVEALALVDRGIAQNGRDPNLRDTRAHVLLKMPGRLADARAEFEHCLELSPPDSPERAQALLALVRACAELADKENARRWLTEADRMLAAQPGVYDARQQSELNELRIRVQEKP